MTVTWSGVPNPNPSTDWIGVYSPSTADPRQTSVIKFKLTNSAQSSGSTTFRLINMRADYIFAFFRNGMTSPVLAAWSNNVTFSNCASCRRPFWQACSCCASCAQTTSRCWRTCR